MNLKPDAPFGDIFPSLERFSDMSVRTFYDVSLTQSDLSVSNVFFIVRHFEICFCGWWRLFATFISDNCSSAGIICECALVSFRFYRLCSISLPCGIMEFRLVKLPFLNDWWNLELCEYCDELMSCFFCASKHLVSRDVYDPTM